MGEKKNRFIGKYTALLGEFYDMVDKQAITLLKLTYLDVMVLSDTKGSEKWKKVIY